MHFKLNHAKFRESDRITGIAPIFRFDTATSQVHLIGSGFWISKRGHLVTAWHVIADNIDKNGKDLGPIFAIQTFADRSIAVRGFKSTDKHPKFDLAFTETVPIARDKGRPTQPTTMSLDDLCIGQQVFSFAVLSYSQEFEHGNDDGHTLFKFRGVMFWGDLPDPAIIKFSVRLSFGNVKEIYKEKRDNYMLPFPCVQTDVPIYGGNSGGPLFDVQGRISAVNCTSFGGLPVAYHMPIQGVLSLRTTPQSIGIRNSARKYLAVGELASMGKVLFDPPMLERDKVFKSSIRYFWYKLKCRLKGETPSKNIHFAISEEHKPNNPVGDE